MVEIISYILCPYFDLTPLFEICFITCSHPTSLLGDMVVTYLDWSRTEEVNKSGYWNKNHFFMDMSEKNKQNQYKGRRWQILIVNRGRWRRPQAETGLKHIKHGPETVHVKPVSKLSIDNLLTSWSQKVNLFLHLRLTLSLYTL